MDFSFNLGKFSTINPSNTGLPLAYNLYPTIQSLQHIPIPSCSHSWFIHHPFTSLTYSGSMHPLPRGPFHMTFWSQQAGTHGIYPSPVYPGNQQIREFQSHILEVCILHQMDHFIWQLGKQEPMAYMPQLSIQATSRSRSFRLVYFRLFF